MVSGFISKYQKCFKRIDLDSLSKILKVDKINYGLSSLILLPVFLVVSAKTFLRLVLGSMAITGHNFFQMPHKLPYAN